MKKLAPFFLIISFLFCLAGCKEKEPIHLVIKTPLQEMNTISDKEIRSIPDFLSKASTEFSHERPEIRPDIKTFNYVDEIKAVTETFDTPAAPDILFGAFFNLSGYIDTGRVAPLDDVVAPFREDLEPFALKIGSREDRLYLLPFLSMQNILIYNKNLFRECGLERFIGQGREIQNWSLPEWEEILDTLAKKLPAGKYPLAIFAKNNQGDTHILSYLRAFGGAIFNEKGDFDFQQPNIVKALAWLQEGVRKGWFPPHPATLEMKDCSELFANGQLVIYMFNNANRAIYSNLNNYGFVNYPGDIATAFYNGFIVFDNGDPAKLRAAKDFLTYLYTTDKWLDLSAGNIPASQKTLEKYKDRIVMIKEFTQNSPHVVDFLNKSPNWQGKADSFRSVFWPNINKLLDLKITPEQCAIDLDEACNRALELGRQNRKLHQ